MPHTGVLLQPQKTNYRRHLTDTIKKESHTSNSLLTWCHQESNRGHKDFQSFALPTELWHLSFCECKGNMFLRNCKTNCVFFCIYHTFSRSKSIFTIFPRICNVKRKINRKSSFVFHILFVILQPQSESSAVGSALRSGRRGRAFESPLSDDEW